jgi:hypothetical protein
MLDFTHGEAKFKQAFVNACHFAESMTVIGPVTQVETDDYHTYLRNALLWKTQDHLGDNAAFFSRLKKFMAQNGLNNSPSEAWAPPGEHLLHVMPDLTLRRTGDELTCGAPSIERDVFAHMFLESKRDFDNTRWGMNVLREKTSERPLLQGAPTFGLLAVVFTFKKPTGYIPSRELTHLGSWPPVVFMLPVLVPAASSFNASYSSFSTVRKSIVEHNPALMTYQIRLREASNRSRTTPFGQPYKLTSVNEFGKEPDILRSLADVFKALWSQVAQYSAWNFSFNWKPDDDTSKVNAEFSLDPMGAGRRIRGHNRFQGKYDAQMVSMLWERNWPEFTGRTPAEVVAWNAGRYKNRLIQDYTGKEIFRTQLRSSWNSNKQEAIFVTPSYFHDSIGKEMFPVALTLMRWMQSYKGGIEDFLHGGIVASVDPANAEDEDSTHGGNTVSFMDRAQSHVGNNVLRSHRGALPVHSTHVDMAFDKSGDPTVFGLSMGAKALKAMDRHTPELAITAADMSEVVDGTEVMGDFKFLDAFCSKSTKELTEVFDSVKKKSINKEGGGLTDPSMVIDLFGESDDGEMF